MFSCRQIRHTRTKQFPFKSLKGFVEQPLTYFEDFKNQEILDLFLSSLKLFVEKKVESWTVIFLLCLKKDTLFYMSAWNLFKSSKNPLNFSKKTMNMR